MTDVPALCFSPVFPCLVLVALSTLQTPAVLPRSQNQVFVQKAQIFLAGECFIEAFFPSAPMIWEMRPRTRFDIQARRSPLPKSA